MEHNVSRHSDRRSLDESPLTVAGTRKEASQGTVAPADATVDGRQDNATAARLSAWTPTNEERRRS